MRLTTARLLVRPFTEADAPYVVQALNEPSFLANIGDRGVRTPDDALRWLRDGPLASYAARGHGILAVEERATGAVVGMCGLIKREVLPEVDLGYAFLPAAWGRGYALEAAAAVRDEGRRALGLARILAIVSPGNGPSVRVLQQLGFREAGALRLPGEAADVALYEWTA